MVVTGEVCSSWDEGFGGTGDLPAGCGRIPSSTDLNSDDTNGQRKALTYTIGFQTDQALLQETASRGGGRRYTATNADQLATAFQGALLNILTTDTSFTSPAVSVDSFTGPRFAKMSSTPCSNPTTGSTGAATSRASR
ncbi:MAG: hypothetical protein U5K56_01595 [Halioglobus sp.]|nr:hypothetical protein [Halioglobus sp.]